MSHLFTPLQIRSVTFKNRIFVSPMCQYSCADDGVPNAWHTVHLGSRAVGGAALVITEATAVCPEGRISPQDTGLYNDAQERAFTTLAQGLHNLGTVPGIQLAHAGRKASTYAPWKGKGRVPPDLGGWQVLGPTAEPFEATYPQPRPMTEQDIARTVQQFVHSAQRAARAGFRVLELHFAHGYLAAQFLGRECNTRTDAYGGASLENRARFALEVAAAVRTVWPAELPLFARLSVTNWLDPQRDTRESVQVASWLRERGVDFIDCSSGGLVPHAAIPVGPGYQVPGAHAIKAGAGVLTGAVGMITEPAQAETIVAEGHADAVLLARALLRDPYWPLHAASTLGVTVPWPVQYGRLG